jgi:cation:H+ antiporter
LILPGWYAEWAKFLVCGLAIMVSGAQLCRYGDVLAVKTGMGRTWIGLVLIAAATSLPEMATGASAILWVQAPNITVGDLLGSCVFNLLILALVDLLYPPGPALTAADRGHLLAAAFGVVMLGLAVMGVMAHSPIESLNFAHVGFSSPVLIICYLVAMRAVYRYQVRERTVYLKEVKEGPAYEGITLNQALARFGLNALVVLAAGVWLPRAASHIAQLAGWHQSFMGTIFVAASTSLPEVVVTLSALRLKAIDLAVGNLFGSNLINLGLLGVMDLIYLPGPLLQMAAPAHAATGLMAVLMTGIAAAELAYRPQKKSLRWLSLGAFSLAFLYAAHIFLQILAGSG